MSDPLHFLSEQEGLLACRSRMPLQVLHFEDLGNADQAYRRLKTHFLYRLPRLQGWHQDQGRQLLHHFPCKHPSPLQNGHGSESDCCFCPCKDGILLNKQCASSRRLLLDAPLHNPQGLPRLSHSVMQFPHNFLLMPCDCRHSVQ